MLKNDYSFHATVKWIIKNAKKLATIGTIYGCITEIRAAEDAGGDFVNKKGYDYTHPTLGKVEVKCTIAVQRGANLRIQSFQGKRNLFDWIEIIDGHNNRKFRIKHDDWFEYVGVSTEFIWSSTYNKTNSVMPANGAFLLKYEIKK